MNQSISHPKINGFSTAATKEGFIGVIYHCGGIYTILYENRNMQHFENNVHILLNTLSAPMCSPRPIPFMAVANGPAQPSQY